jgi:hypothetical protein
MKQRNNAGPSIRGLCTSSQECAGYYFACMRACKYVLVVSVIVVVACMHVQFVKFLCKFGLLYECDAL